MRRYKSLMAAQARIHLAFVFAAVLLRRLAQRDTPRPFPRKPDRRGEEVNNNGTLCWRRRRGTSDALANVIHADPVCLFYFGGWN